LAWLLEKLGAMSIIPGRGLDPLWAQAHDPDIRALLRVCNVHNVPLATNLGTADLIITALSPHVAAHRGSHDAA
jgi:methylglyoxal synthase